MNEYSLIAETYDLLLTPFLLGMRKKILEISRSLAPGEVVDLCCGTGHQLKLLGRAGIKNLVCVDLSEEMLHVAGRGRFAPECKIRDASDTGFPDSCFDLAIISLALHEKKHQKALGVLSEAYRILKPGAHLIVSDYLADGSPPPYVSAAIRFIEFLAGGEHFSNYKGYMRTRGLSALRDATKFRVLSRQPAVAGGVTVEVWEKID